MVMQPVIDAWRHTFPKDIRFCRQCIILHSELNSISRRYRDKKFIPRGEIQAVVDNWADVPYSWMRMRLLRWVTCVPLINTVRIRKGEAAWLYTKAVKIEHTKLDAWLSKDSNKKVYIPRDVFQREVLDVLHVPAAYHYIFIFFATICVLLVLFIIAVYSAEYIVYAYLRWWHQMTRTQMIDWYEQIALKHCVTELPDAYRNAMVPTAFVRPGGDLVFFNVVEMTSPERDCRVVFIPFPRVAPVEFYRNVGAICKTAQAVILEECSLEALKTLPPAYFFPLKDEPFPALGAVHHRYWDLLTSGDVAPPKLLPGNVQLEWYDKYFQGMLPFPLKTVYFPNSWSGTRTDARTGWGRIKEAVHDTSLMSVACPWTPYQITNLKCSLIKEDWKVTRVESIPWMRPRLLGENFCDYFGVPQDEPDKVVRAPSSAAVEPPSSAASVDGLPVKRKPVQLVGPASSPAVPSGR